jgi:hypothetical protein
LLKKKKRKNLFAERKVITGVSAIGYDISAHAGVMKRAGFLLTYKKYSGMIPLSQKIGARVSALSEVEWAHRRAEGMLQDGDGEDDNSQKAP